MPKRDNTARLADKYELSDLEPGVDPEKAAAFLAKAAPRQGGQCVTAKLPDPKRVPIAQSAPSDMKTQFANDAELWTSRTIRLRQSTATCLTKAACRQKMKQAEGKLTSDEPVTVQQIADHGIRLALAELGYDK